MLPFKGNGAFLDDQSIGSRWTSEELRQYGHSINCLELLAIYLAIRAFSDSLQNRNICVCTAVSYINPMGGTHSELCNILAKEIWNSAQRINLYINATHIPGVDNVEGPVPHMLIGFFKDNAEIMLKPSVFASICTDLDNFPTVDLFATRHNKQLPVFSSWKPDPKSSFIDSLFLD